MGSRLNDDQLRAAAARRPGYATYPVYAPIGPERLGRMPAVTGRRGYPSTGWISAVTAPEVPAGPAPATAPPRLPEAALDARPPVPAAAPVAVTLVALPESPVFDFQPCRIGERPWWRRRWHWGVIAAGARTHHGYAWTEAGARRRTARAARRVAGR